MSDLRILEIPPNRGGLGEGTWLRWGELRLWLLDRDQIELAEAIEEQILSGDEVECTERKVRL